MRINEKRERERERDELLLKTRINTPKGNTQNINSKNVPSSLASFQRYTS